MSSDPRVPDGVTRCPLSDEMRTFMEQDVQISLDKRWNYKKLALGLYELGRDWPPLDLFVQPHTILHEWFSLTPGFADYVAEDRWNGTTQGHVIKLGLWDFPGEPREDYYKAHAKGNDNRLVLAEWWQITNYIPDDGDCVAHPELKGFALLRNKDLATFVSGMLEDIEEDQE